MLSTYEFGRCAQLASPLFGMWTRTYPFADRAALQIVVHIRTGDLNLRWPSYARLINVLTPVLQSYKSVIHIVCKEGSDDKFIEKVQLHISSLVEKAVPRRNSCVVVIERTGTVQRALLMMMHSDVLVSAGSSFTSIVGTFSNRPIYIERFGSKYESEANELTASDFAGEITSGSGFIHNKYALHHRNITEVKFALLTQLLPRLWQRGLPRPSSQDQELAAFVPVLQTLRIGDFH